MWWDGVLAFAGGVFGSGLTFLAVRFQTRSEQEARRREEWGRRFTIALDLITSPESHGRAIGMALAEELLRSELATSQDRREVRTVLETMATPGSVDLQTLPPAAVARLRVVRDNETRSTEEDQHDH